MPDDTDRSGKTQESREILSYQDLIALARDKSHESRSALFGAISDLATNGESMLTATDRELMRDIISSLIEDVELSVRRALALRLAEVSDVPRELIVCLANDDITVARRVLLKSTLLRDPELIEIIQHRTMEHQVAVAMRRVLSEPVADALVWTDHPEVILTLLENQHARISEITLERLTDKSIEDACYRAPLLHRDELPPRLARKLYWTISAALREYIVKHFDIDPTQLDDTIEATVEDTVTKEIGAADGKAGKTPKGPANKKDRQKLIRLFEKGEIPDFVNLFSGLSGLRTTLIRRILFEAGGQGTAILCKAIGLDKDGFAPIFLRFRQGRLGENQVEPGELGHALRDFDRITTTNARRMVTRWRRNPEYLNALRLVEQTPG